jgi:hypothetical protein
MRIALAGNVVVAAGWFGPALVWGIAVLGLQRASVPMLTSIGGFIAMTVFLSLLTFLRPGRLQLRSTRG